MKAWLEDAGGEFKENAEDYTEALALAGYRSRRGLRGLDGTGEIQTALAIPRGVAKELVVEAHAMQIRRGVRPMAAIEEGDARAMAPADWPGFEGKLAISAEQAKRAMVAPGDAEGGGLMDLRHPPREEISGIS